MTMKLLIILQKFQEIHHTITQKQLQIKKKILELLEKYLEKDMYHQKKDKKLLMISD